MRVRACARAKQASAGNTAVATVAPHLHQHYTYRPIYTCDLREATKRERRRFCSSHSPLLDHRTDHTAEEQSGSQIFSRVVTHSQLRLPEYRLPTCCYTWYTADVALAVYRYSYTLRSVLLAVHRSTAKQDSNKRATTKQLSRTSMYASKGFYTNIITPLLAPASASRWKLDSFLAR